MSDSFVPRRSFLTRLAVGAAVVGTVPALACAAPAPVADALSPLDELETWLGTKPGAHKCIYDCVQPAGATDGILFARNFMTYSHDELATADTDMSVIVSFRHFATPYAYNDAIWSKYPQIAAMFKIDDPKTKKPAVRNIALTDEVLGQSGASLTALRARGARFTACGAATSFIADALAGPTGDAAAVRTELLANLVPGARVVPAGVVVVQRAQKVGFAYTFAG